MKTAAAFLQGFLELDGNLIPIIFSMVRQDQPVLGNIFYKDKQIF